MNTHSLLIAVLLVVLSGCQAVAPESTPSVLPVTEVATEEPAATVEVESTPAITATTSATTESGSSEEITATVEMTPTGVQGSEVSDLATLVDALRAAGATVEPQGQIEQVFLSVPGQQILVNGGNVQVFEYASAEAAAADASQISPDGTSTATTMITWVEPPHFYQKERLLVLYVGSDEAIQALLTGLLGPQFAGQ